MMQSKEIGRPDSRDQRMREMRTDMGSRNPDQAVPGRSQSLAVAQSKGEREDQTFIEAITD